jgi:hypothetical protein
MNNLKFLQVNYQCIKGKKVILESGQVEVPIEAVIENTQYSKYTLKELFYKVQKEPYFINKDYNSIGYLICRQ